MNIAMYQHGGSKNHGCEAIIRSIAKLFNEDITIYSNQPKEDIEYGINEICKVESFIHPLNRYSFEYLKCWYSYYIKKEQFAFDKAIFRHIYRQLRKYDVMFSIGGDNYCYKVPSYIFTLNNELKNKKANNILFGCSIELENITTETKKHLENYSHIIARESITFNDLKNNGFTNISLYPDTAFILESKKLPLPEGFIENNTVGINISPLINNYEYANNIVIHNYIELIKFILSSTKFNIALIPHVVWENNDDRYPLSQLYELFKDSKRVILINDYTAEVLKGYISRCRFMIAARTHASIAAYSTQVPTLVIGYSVKSKGIAKDIFGTYENYVIPVQNLETKYEIKEKFIWLMKNENIIRKHYQSFMPQYINRLYDLKKKIKSLLVK